MTRLKVNSTLERKTQKGNMGFWQAQTTWLPMVHLVFTSTWSSACSLQPRSANPFASSPCWPWYLLLFSLAPWIQAIAGDVRCYVLIVFEMFFSRYLCIYAYMYNMRFDDILVITIVYIYIHYITIYIYIYIPLDLYTQVYDSWWCPWLQLDFFASPCFNKASWASSAMCVGSTGCLARFYRKFLHINWGLTCFNQQIYFGIILGNQLDWSLYIYISIVCSKWCGIFLLHAHLLRAAAPAADPGRIGKEAKQIGIKTLRCFAPWGFRPFSYVYCCEIYLIGLNFHL